MTEDTSNHQRRLKTSSTFKLKRKLQAAKNYRLKLITAKTIIVSDLLQLEKDKAKAYGDGFTDDDQKIKDLKSQISGKEAARDAKQAEIEEQDRYIIKLEDEIWGIGKPTSIPTGHDPQKALKGKIPWPSTGGLSVEGGLGEAPIKPGDSPVRRAVDLVALQREINEMVYKPQASALAVAPDPLLANSSAVPVAGPVSGPAKPLLAYDLAITPPDAGIAGPVAPIAPPPVPVLSVPGSGIDPVYGHPYELPDDPEIFPLPRNPTFRDAYCHHSSKQRVQKRLVELGLKKPK